MTLDQRHLDRATLAAMYNDARQAGERIAAEEKIGVAWQKLWQIQPFPFHPELIDLADESIREICGISHRLPSGPLHDAAEVCRAGVPTVMLFKGGEVVGTKVGLPRKADLTALIDSKLS